MSNVYIQKKLAIKIIQLGKDVKDYANKAILEKLKREGVEVE